MAASLANPFISSTTYNSSFRIKEQGAVNGSPCNLFCSSIRPMKEKFPTFKKSLRVQARYSGDAGRSSSASIFVGGFILGGVVVGALGCIYAPQISKTLAGTDRKDLMRKLPKFVYDEEKALERQRKILAEKIDQLNSAIDDVSSQLRADDPPNGVASTPDEIEAAT